MSSTTALSKSSGPSFYLDGMELGTGIDAITGEISKSALDPNFSVRETSTNQSHDTFFFRAMSDVTELESSAAFGASSSLTFPADGVKVGASRAFDFTNNEQSTTSVLLIVFDWERRGHAKQVTGAKLSDEAQADLLHDKDGFRDMYGDYYIHQISYMLKFTAIWKCATENSSSMKAFKHEISGSLSASEMEASGSFTTELKSAAKKHQVTVEVKYQVVGDAGSTQYDKGDTLKTFNSFRDVAKPIPNEVLLRHYSTVNGKVPAVINMQPQVFERICNVFTSARFVLFLIGVVPGTRAVRLSRRDKLYRIFREIYSKRIAFQRDHNALKDAIKELEEMRKVLWLRLERQDLVIEARSNLYDDLKRKFAVDHENVRGAWVRASENVGTYALGRVGFSDEEQKKYAILHKTVAEVRVGFVLFQQQVGALEFPGTSGINGYVVGLVVESCWKDGTNGWWCIGRELMLGTKQAKVEVKTEGSRGMHWRLQAYYIPSSEYDE